MKIKEALPLLERALEELRGRYAQVFQAEPVGRLL